MADIGYTKPTWVNGNAPPVSAANLQALSDALSAVVHKTDRGTAVLEADTVTNGALLSRTTLDSGKVIHLSADGLPEYPDSVAGTTYLQDAWATTDSWVPSGGGSATVASSILTWTTTANTEFLRRTASVVSASTFKIKCRAISGSPGPIALLSNLGNTGLTFTPASEWTIFSLSPTTNWTGTLSIITLSRGSGDASATIEIEFIYVGSGVYDTKLPDVSGNGNDATVYGSTPINEVVGKGLLGDGINDYCDITASLPLYFTMSAWIQRLKSGAVQHAFGALGTVIGAYVRCSIRFDASNNLTLQTLNVGDASITNTTIVADDGALKLITVTYDGSAVLIYVNGVLATTKSGAISPSVLPTIRLFNEPSSGFLTPFKGTVSDPRIYNRALSADEVWELYQKPKQAGAPVTAVAIHNLLGSNRTAPAAITSPGVKGQIAVDASYIYIHTGVQWERAAIATW
jgi:hypothetical protein